MDKVSGDGYLAGLAQLGEAACAVRNDVELAKNGDPPTSSTSDQRSPKSRGVAPPLPDTATDVAKLLNRDPGVCECARFGKRRLSWLQWLGGKPPGGMLDKLNKELFHEHLFFDSTGDNIGFGPGHVEGWRLSSVTDGELFSESAEGYNYTIESSCYDGSRMRAAVKSIVDQGTGRYYFFFKNCQTFMQRVRERYLSLSGSKL